MVRVVGIDPGTVSFDICGLQDGDVFLERSVPTNDAYCPTLRGRMGVTSAA